MSTKWIAAVFVALATPAIATGNGMYLCPTPAIANSFWQDVVQARQLNLAIISDVLKRIGEKNQCRLVLASDLKPIDFEYTEMLISGGSVRGWADPHIYIRYINGSNS